MKIAIIRNVRHSAGSLQRLYLAVKTASKSETTDFRTLREWYIRNGGKYLGLHKPQSVTDLALARELDLLERRKEGGWFVSFGVGRAFLALWERLHQPPKHLLLVQFIKYDQTFLLEFLEALFNAGFPHRKVSLEMVTKNAFAQLWRKYGRDLLLLEPPFPTKLEGKYAWKHYADFRIRFLLKEEGLNLSENQLYQLYNELKKGVNESTLFFTAGRILGKSNIKTIDRTTLIELLTEAYQMLKGLEFASAYGTFCYINEIALTNESSCIDWNTYISILRKDPRFLLQPSFRGHEDVLFKIVR
jgi:hypothetical protein